MYENGKFKQWEPLPSAQSRVCTVTGKSSAMEDVWGELEDDGVQQELGSGIAPQFAVHEDEQEVKERLCAVFGTERKLFLVTDTLPLRLRASPAGSGPGGVGRTWTARWIEDDIRARTPNSIAYDISTVWLGIVTRDCIELSPEDSQPCDGPSADVGSTGAAPVVPAGSAETGEGSLRPLVPNLTAGGLGNLRFDDLASRCGLPLDTTVPDPAGVTLPNLTDEDRIAITRALNAINVVPVFLPQALQAKAGEYYQAVLKPCMHNVLETGSQRVFPSASSLELQTSGWAAFCASNDAVARTVMHVFAKDDVAWIHDYGLGMVPHYLVQQCMSTYGGSRPAMVFYMHAPFPTSEIFRTLHVRDELLHALLDVSRTCKGGIQRAGGGHHMTLPVTSAPAATSPVRHFMLTNAPPPLPLPPSPFPYCSAIWWAFIPSTMPGTSFMQLSVSLASHPAPVVVAALP